MNKILLVVITMLLAPLSALAQPVAIDLVPVGNAGNGNDSNTGDRFGGVAYDYRIGKYDVTVGQYTVFLNAVAKGDIYQLYNPNMASDSNVAGIARSGSSGSYSYSVIGSPNQPVTYVSWGDAVRFANWLSNGQPTGPSGTGTEVGSYAVNGATDGTGLSAVTRGANATWVIPTESEWYKGAYYNPSTNSYFHYPFSSDVVPTSAAPSGAANAGNFFDFTTGYVLTGSTTLSSSQHYLTDVGAYAGSVSPYGALDMGGNVFQWNETLISGSLRPNRGGSWDNFYGYLSCSFRNNSLSTQEEHNIGFRVALVPEPGTAALLAIGGVIALAVKRRYATDV